MSYPFNYLMIVLGWLIFGFIHSFLASEKLKLKAYGKGISPLNYRKLYTLLSVILILAVLLLGSFIEPVYFMPINKSSESVGLIIATFGFLLTKLSFKNTSFRSFLGLKEEEKSPKLQKAGIYARIRHPLYTATILFLIGFAIFSPSYVNLLHAVCLFIYLMIGVQYEEKRLIRTFGKEYEDYKEQVPMLLPRFGLRK
ncbi:NnrU family protein [Marivirga lumbricoides]